MQACIAFHNMSGGKLPDVRQLANSISPAQLAAWRNLVESAPTTKSNDDDDDDAPTLSSSDR